MKSPRKYITGLSLGVFFLLSGDFALGFSGENLLTGSPWHHADITCRALVGDAQCEMPAGHQPVYHDELGFSKNAALRVAWHADYLDSYIYSPIWWSSAGAQRQPVRSIRHRFLAGMANYWQLASLHFDDLTSTEEVETAWNRYLSGAIIGLEWAAGQDDVQAAYNILGLGLHATQDFYSHSTWMNRQSRRGKTYWDMSSDERNRLAISTGGYEHKHAPVKHGAYDLTCTAYLQPPIKGIMETFCASVVPTANMSFCEAYRECEQGDHSPATVDVSFTDLGLLKPDYIILHPPGISMDNTWLSRIGADERNLTEDRGRRMRSGATGANRNVHDVNVQERCKDIIGFQSRCERESDYLFAQGKHLAVIASQQWMEKINEYMNRKHPDFWGKVKNCTGCRSGNNFIPNPPSVMTDQFEDYSKFPFQFMTAGHSKPVARPDENGWYLRLETQTANEHGAGTNADIKVIGKGRGEDYLLDYLPMADPKSPLRVPGLTYDDMEPGDKQTYTIGPFRELPTELVLFNDSGSGAEVRRALRRRMRSTFESGFESARHFFRNDQDFVGVKSWAPTRADLDEAIRHGGFETITVNGGAEGIYEIRLKVERTNWRGRNDQRGWAEYRISLQNLYCKEESSVDGVTSDDEPFFFASLSTYGDNTPQFGRFGPYENVDSGETVAINHRFQTFRLPRTGAAYMAFEVFESDKEKSRDRQALYDKFRGVTTEAEASDYPEFAHEIGRTAGTPWKLEGLKVYAFQRGRNPKFGKVYDARPNIWMNDDERRTFRLDLAKAMSLGIDPVHMDTSRSVFSDINNIGMFAELGSRLGYGMYNTDSSTKTVPVVDIPQGRIKDTVRDQAHPGNISKPARVKSPKQLKPHADELENTKTCFNAVQGKIPWFPNGSKQWAPANINRICKGNETSTHPAECFKKVMYGKQIENPKKVLTKTYGLPRLDGKSWLWQEAADLCKGAQHVSKRLDCFARLQLKKKSVQASIKSCALK